MLQLCLDLTILDVRSWMVKCFRLSGYHHVETFQPHQTFLGFSWNFHGETCFYIFTILPFGLCVAPYIFTKILRPLVGWRRANGMFELHIYSSSTCFYNPYRGVQQFVQRHIRVTKQYKTTYLECWACHAMSRPISSTKRLV